VSFCSGHTYNAFFDRKKCIITLLLRYFNWLTWPGPYLLSLSQEKKAYSKPVSNTLNAILCLCATSNFDGKLHMNFRKNHYRIGRYIDRFGKNILITDIVDWTTDETVRASLDRWVVEDGFRPEKTFSAPMFL